MDLLTWDWGGEGEEKEGEKEGEKGKRRRRRRRGRRGIVAVIILGDGGKFASRHLRRQLPIKLITESNISDSAQRGM